MKVQELLSDKTKWTKKAFARNCMNEPTFVNSPDAICWCLSGAIMICYSSVVANELRQRIFEHLKIKSIVRWNDNATYEQVIALAKELNL